MGQLGLKSLADIWFIYNKTLPEEGRHHIS